MSPAAKSRTEERTTEERSTEERSTEERTTAKSSSVKNGTVNSTTTNGTAHGVVIIGMGPGDPGLLTLRAAAELERADTVVVNRALCPPEILSHCRPDVEIIDSAGGEPAKLAARAAKKGRRVARLLWGDPG
ncbi:MAG: SAM-dependent methyltransferase, partial [Spirillospora sp.]